MHLSLALALLVVCAPSYAGPATERYASVQLNVGRELLERAHAAAARGEDRLAGKLAWQASLDARLAWRMSEAPSLRADAAELGGEASELIRRLASADGR